MKKAEVNEFIEQMGAIGDEWTEEQVEEVYGNHSLEEALEDRKSSVGKMFDIIETVMNR